MSPLNYFPNSVSLSTYPGRRHWLWRTVRASTCAELCCADCCVCTYRHERVQFVERRLCSDVRQHCGQLQVRLSWRIRTRGRLTQLRRSDTRYSRCL